VKLTTAEAKECVDLYLQSPNTPSWRGAQSKKKHRDNFISNTINVLDCIVGSFTRGNETDLSALLVKMFPFPFPLAEHGAKQ
jgi:hypothetical protein